MLVSLPTSISPSNDRDEALTALRSTVSTENGSVIPFKIPDFKIGTLDALVQQADDLAKLEAASQGVVAKIGDGLRSLLEGDEGKIAEQKVVNDSMFIMGPGYLGGRLADVLTQNLLLNTCGPSPGTKSNTGQTNH